MNYHKLINTIFILSGFISLACVIIFNDHLISKYFSQDHQLEQGSLIALSKIRLFIFIIGSILIIIGFISMTKINISNTRNPSLFIVFLGIVGLSLIMFVIDSQDRSITSRFRNTDVLRLRSEIQYATDCLKSYMQKSDNVYIIYQQSKGFEYQIVRYELTPFQSNRYEDGSPSIGKPYYEGDIWTSNINSQEFIEKLMDYNYLLLAHSDYQFFKNYGSIFHDYNENVFLYKIEIRDESLNLIPFECNQEVNTFIVDY